MMLELFAKLRRLNFLFNWFLDEFRQPSKSIIYMLMASDWQISTKNSISIQARGDANSSSCKVVCWKLKQKKDELSTGFLHEIHHKSLIKFFLWSFSKGLRLKHSIKLVKAFFSDEVLNTDVKRKFHDHFQGGMSWRRQTRDPCVVCILFNSLGLLTLKLFNRHDLTVDFTRDIRQPSDVDPSKSAFSYFTTNFFNVRARNFEPVFGLLWKVLLERVHSRK